MTSAKMQARITELEQTLTELKQQLHESVQLPEMARIPDRHYSVSIAPVTVAQYEYFCTETDRICPDQPEPHDPNNPVVNVTWSDTQDYCKWLSQHTKQSYRLPAEDEFEHFCGNHREATKLIAVYNTDSIKPTRTKEPNQYGLYDVLGLVWEWQKNPYA